MSLTSAMSNVPIRWQAKQDVGHCLITTIMFSFVLSAEGLKRKKM